MNVVDQRTDPIVYFNTLFNGDVFLHGGDPFVKINPIETENRSFNAVNLTNGEPYTFGVEEFVEKIAHAELVMKD